MNLLQIVIHGCLFFLLFHPEAFRLSSEVFGSWVLRVDMDLDPDQEELMPSDGGLLLHVALAVILVFIMSPRPTV